MGDEFEIDFDGTEEANPPVGDEGSEDHVNPFLSNIPDDDRLVVEKYVKDWDAGVTKRFQAIHEQYKPFKGVDTTKFEQAMYLHDMANNNPMELYMALDKWVKENEQMDDIDVIDENLVDLPDAAAKQVQMLKSQIEELNGKLTEKLQNDETEKQMAELDKTMGKLHNKYGDFDDEPVLLRMRKGMSPEDAVKDYNKWLDNLVSSRTKKPTPFPTLNGAGGSPLGQVDRSKLTDAKTRKELVMQALAAAKGN